MKVTYLSHSGFMIEHEDTAMLFDYYEGTLPEIEGKQLVVFASHNHSDHYTKEVFDFNADKYILSYDIKAGKKDNILYVQPGTTYEVQLREAQMTIETFKSTDEGVAFFVTYKGKTIYHAGDLHLWAWYEEGDEYVEDMKRQFYAYTKDLVGRHVDAAFLLLDYRLGDGGFEGMDAYRNMLKADHIFPMHQWDIYHYTKKYLQHTGELPDFHVIEYKGQEFEI